MEDKTKVYISSTLFLLLLLVNFLSICFGAVRQYQFDQFKADVWMQIDAMGQNLSALDKINNLCTGKEGWTSCADYTQAPDMTFTAEALEIMRENNLCVFEDYTVGTCYPDAPKN